METKSKVETFIGFSIKASKCRFGMNTVSTLKKANVIIVCKSVGENTLKEAVKISVKLKCKLYKTVNKTLSELTHRENCKVIAIQDYGLGKAIIENSCNELEIWENKKD